ncbi:MAG: (d)CMP kinase [Nitrospirae bacterium]|nr:(d)CMP kinase [Nitrospirota bacterium]
MAARTTTGLIVAIDGPAGSGKSSAARLLAKRLGYLYLDTGALYRAVGWKALKEKADLRDEEALRGLCAGLDLVATPHRDGTKVYVDGRDITGEIRTPEVSRAAAAVAAAPAVRRRLLEVQRAVGKNVGPEGGVVVEGRDIGTVVFPEAPVKFFLDASTEIRVKRRYRELKQQGLAVDLTGTRREIDMRDLSDASREVAPLRPAEDAIRIDSTALGQEEVVAAMVAAIEEKAGR